MSSSLSNRFGGHGAGEREREGDIKGREAKLSSNKEAVALLSVSVSSSAPGIT